MPTRNYQYLDAYLNDLLGQGRYTVSWNELQERFDASGKAILQSVYRLKRKGRLAQVRKGFYAIVPPAYASRGMVPYTLFVDDLMGHLDRAYYVGALSAAALHGAGHQQPMQFQVMIHQPALRNIRNDKLDLRFFVKSAWDPGDVKAIKTDTGYLRVSRPSLTAFDLVTYSKQIGGINRILPVLEDLCDSIPPADLATTAQSQPMPSIQRLGFLLERLEKEAWAAPLQERLHDGRVIPVPLSLAHHDHRGESDARWKVVLNTELDG